jgi:ATP dependent DNA ligase domain
MSRTSTLPKRLQPMLATLTDGPFDDAGWVFEDKYDGFRMVAEIGDDKVTLYSRNGKIISHSYIEVAKALEGVKGRRGHRRRTRCPGQRRCVAFPADAECAAPRGEAPLLRIRPHVL